MSRWLPVAAIVVAVVALVLVIVPELTAPIKAPASEPSDGFWEIMQMYARPRDDTYLTDAERIGLSVPQLRLHLLRLKQMLADLDNPGGEPSMEWLEREPGRSWERQSLHSELVQTEREIARRK